MSEKLETIVEKLIKKQSDSLFGADADITEKEESIAALKERMIAQVYSEVKEEVRDAALQEAEQILDEKAHLQQIKELKKLTISGFIVAIFVGVLVNQITDVIGFYKGSVSLDVIWPTVIISSVLLAICVAIFAGMFLAEVLKLLRKGKNEKN